jgi:putative transcriptional regulator
MQNQVHTTSTFRELLRSTTHKDLAKNVGVSRSLISAIANGLRKPSLPVAIKIAKHFNKNIEELFVLDEEAKKCL